VSRTGSVPFPARVSRDDVASLAVAAALFTTPRYDDEDGKDTKRLPTTTQDAFHYTLGCRWVGQELDPFPAQGVKADGSKDAATALRRTLKIIEKNELRNRKRIRERSRNEANGGKGDLTSASSHLAHRGQRRKRNPHGLCVAIPVYIMLGLFARTLLYPVINGFPGGANLLVQLNEWVRLGASMITGKLGTVLPSVVRRKQYISL
jgi:hypothetical protein